MKSKFIVLPERKVKELVSIYNVCRCGHSDHYHEYDIERIEPKNPRDIASYETVYYKCKNCVCQKFKEVVKMDYDNYYKFKNRFLLRKEKLQFRADIMKRELILVPITFNDFMVSLEPVVQIHIVKESKLSKVKDLLKRFSK